ncbi:DegT/DnrJ/EryC1/StrS family aminotransferase, partial [Candidatus Uhrbacteria bacterium]|nr:DegT/DnrJ/EryC1/StrS family aminotransferase [Candidatus Uhrbacteria bacterium]
AALYAAYLGLGIGPGDEVIVPANTFIATAEAASMTGGTPVFVDIDPATHHLDVKDLDRAATARTKAVAVVHLFGMAADVEAVKAWAAPKGIAVVEDTAQGHGAMCPNGRMAGTSGAVGCFSFYPTKNLGAFGEGGAAVTDDDALAGRLRAIRAHGATVQNRHETFGTNLRMEALQGALLNVRLPRLAAAADRRRAIADRYRAGLAGLALALPPDVGPRHVYHLFVIATDRRDDLKAHLASKGIGAAIHYPTACPDQPVYASRGIAGSCPNATAAASRILSLPMFAEMTDAEADETVAAVRAFFAT